MLSVPTTYLRTVPHFAYGKKSRFSVLPMNEKMVCQFLPWNIISFAQNLLLPYQFLQSGLFHQFLPWTLINSVPKFVDSVLSFCPEISLLSHRILPWKWLIYITFCFPNTWMVVFGPIPQNDDFHGVTSESIYSSSVPCPEIKLVSSLKLTSPC